MQSLYQGQLYLAGSSRCQTVYVSVHDGQLRVYSQDQQTLLFRYTRSEIKASSKVADLPREVVLPGRDLLSLECSEAVNQWLDAGSHLSAAARLEKSRSWIVASVLLAPLLLYGLFKYLVPSLAITFAAYVPATLTSLTSQHTLSALDKTVLSASELDESARHTLHAAFEPILMNVGSGDIAYQVMFRRSEQMGANAFALPDGSIVFTDEIVELMQADPKLLSAILLHEIGHVEHRHSMRLIAESLATTLVITYFFADASGLVEMFMGVSGTVIQNKYSQKLEWEADTYALENAEKAGLNAGDFAEAMQTLAASLPAESESDHWFSSHPLLQARIKRARELATKAAQ